MTNGVENPVKQFWDWFGANAKAIAADVENSIWPKEIDDRLLNLAPGLSWEIGPGKIRPWQLVISPNLDRKLRETARAIVAEAPELDGWEFYSSRQPKDWKYEFELEGQDEAATLSINAAAWHFVLLKYPGGNREILLRATGLQDLDDERRQQVGEIVLEGLLGEDIFLDSVEDFDIVDEFDPQFVNHARPIQRLRAAVIGEDC